MKFPKVINTTARNATALKFAGAFASAGVALEIYATTGDWRLAAAALASSVLAGNIIATKGEGTTQR